jgi:hypothetical protein
MNLSISTVTRTVEDTTMYNMVAHMKKYFATLPDREPHEANDMMIGLQNEQYPKYLIIGHTCVKVDRLKSSNRKLSSNQLKYGN